MDLTAFNQQSQRRKKENRKFLDHLKNKPRKDLDEIFRHTHEAVFENTNCLSCANCCKTTSPIFYQRDVERASKALRIKPGQFIAQYLKEDEENDLVLRQAPCPFLDNSNNCRIYDDRPAACREYPHTNRRKMQQILDLTYQNTLVCPAVLRIVETLKERLKV